jgi:hypothetical protein
MTKSLSRREFMKASALLAAAGFNAAAAPYPVWQKPSREQVLSWLADPLFFWKKDAFGRRIITPQYQKSQYEEYPDAFGFRNNGCGYAVIASLAKLYGMGDTLGFLESGVIPDIKSGQIIKMLKGFKFKSSRGTDIYHEVIAWDYQTYMDGMDEVFQLLFGDRFNIEILTREWGSEYTQVVNRLEWPDLMDRAESICNDLGMVFVFGIKHGRLDGHFVLCSALKSDNGRGKTIVLESYDATVFETVLKNWLPLVTDPEHKEMGPQVSLLGMIGLTPKLEFANNTWTTS